MTENNNHVNPRVFVSYSWDSPEHKLWVESLAGELHNSYIYDIVWENAGWGQCNIGLFNLSQ